MGKKRLSVYRAVIHAFAASETGGGVRVKDLTAIINARRLRGKYTSEASVSDRLNKLLRAGCAVKDSDGGYRPVGDFADAVNGARRHAVKAAECAERAERLAKTRAKLAK